MKGPLDIDFDLKRPGTSGVAYVRPRGTGGFAAAAADTLRSDTYSPDLHAHPEVRQARSAAGKRRSRVLHIEPSEDPAEVRQQLDAFAVCLAWYASAAEVAAAFIREVLNLEPESVPEVWIRYAIEARAMSEDRGEPLTLGALPVHCCLGIEN